MKIVQKTVVCLSLLLVLAFVASPVFAVQKINLNTATVSQLSELPGIGGKTAQKIVDYRSKNKFLKVEDLLNVKGIGQKKFVKIKDLLVVGSQ